jgi:hypothetical protein
MEVPIYGNLHRIAGYLLCSAAARKVWLHGGEVLQREREMRWGKISSNGRLERAVEIYTVR